MTTKFEKMERVYHSRCRALCDLMGADLHGSSINGGFAFYEKDGRHRQEMADPTLVRLERLYAELQQLRKVRDAARLWRQHRRTTRAGESELCDALDACEEAKP